jgi:CheY-like chemotaxis protein
MLGKRDTPTSSLKEQIAKHLRAADSYAKEGKYDNAMIEIQRALKLDPKNYYARSFQERLHAELNKAQQKAVSKAQQETDDADRKHDAVSQLLRNADQLIAAKDYKGALREVAKVYQIDPHNYFANSYSDRIDILMTQEAEARRTASAQAVGLPQSGSQPKPVVQTGKPASDIPQPQPTKLVPQPIGSTQPSAAPAGQTISNEKASLTMYRQLLKEMWFDGKITSEEDQELRKVRQMFNISQQEHEEAEKQVHIEAYVDALKIAWRDGVISQTESAVLELMRQKFNISMEEHLSAEARILWAKNNNALTKGMILIVEDDKTLLLSLAAKLKRHGYDVITAEKVENAIKLLEQTTPVLILSDLMFGPGEKTGLEFYLHVRNFQKFKETPFLLMSGISDEFVVRAGVRMGVDDFLAKPFDLELLLATVEGKLKSS